MGSSASFSDPSSIEKSWGLFMTSVQHVALDPAREHVDPLDPNVPPPDRSKWAPEWQAAWTSPEMEAFREGLRLRGLPDIRSAVLDDLSSYFRLDAEACIYQATHSHELSAEEWLAKPVRTSEDEITDFYLHHVRPWVFGLLWYAYLQAEGYKYPISVVIAQDLRGRRGGACLDFGAGIGATAQMFALLGYTPSLADISTPLLDFARYRLERRGQLATFIDLNHQPVGRNAYTVITAVNTLHHLPDLPSLSKTAHDLHSALRPGGLLVADFDVSPRHRGAARLYDDDLPLRRVLRHAGFEQRRHLGVGMFRYEKVADSGVLHAVRGLRDRVVLGNARRYWRSIR